MRWIVGILVALVVLIAAAFWFLSAPDIPRSVMEAKYATPPSQFVEVSYASTLPTSESSSVRDAHSEPTARAHYRVRGPANGPVLLLLHGSNASLFTWEPWAKILSDHFRVVAVDLPGHGLTGATANHDYTQAGMAAFVAAFADRLGLKTFALAGNSMGGGVAARFAEEHPDRVTALILVDAGGLPSKAGDHPPLAFWLLRQSWARPLMTHIDPTPLAREGLNDAVVNKAILTPKMIELYADMARMEGTRTATAERFAEYATTTDRTYVKDHVGVLKMPVLILWGEQDHLIPVGTASTWHKLLPGSRRIIYPRTGHIPMEEAADRSAADVRAFLTAHGQ